MSLKPVVLAVLLSVPVWVLFIWAVLSLTSTVLFVTALGVAAGVAVGLAILRLIEGKP